MLDRNGRSCTAPNLEQEDIVLLKDTTLGSHHWRRVWVIRTFPGEDDLVQVIEIQCNVSKGLLYHRRIRKLALLLHLHTPFPHIAHPFVSPVFIRGLGTVFVR